MYSKYANLTEEEVKQKKKDYHKKYYEKNKDLIIKRSRENALKNPEKKKEYLKEYNKKNYKKIKEKRKDYLKNWNKENKEYYNEYRKNKRKNSGFERLKHNLRNRTNLAFRCNYWKKGKGTEQLLGADFDTVRNHLESLFDEKMTWDNYGEWHIDHIIPLSSAKTESELIDLFNYKNTQPLWAKDNLSKGNRLI
jgi:hypothetical protein